MAETAPGRLFPWVPVAFAIGIALYFAAEREPQWWAATALALAGAISTVAARRRPLAFPLLLAVTAAAAGFATATLKSLALSHPVLTAPAYAAEVSGFVEQREERERSDRIVVRVTRLEAQRAAEKPARVRVTLRKGTAPAVGSHVSFRARLNPPLGPLRPGGYDFARDLYFQGIGASGFVLGAIRTGPEASQTPSLSLRASAAVERMRDAISQRIRQSLPGDRGAIATALITGKRDAIAPEVNEAMYVSSLGHILSISGYHMAVVAGAVFFALRALLALVPSFAARRPIKKWAAAAALGAAAFYLVLSGAQVATQRAFIMTGIVLVGVMCDRPALTLRTLAVAAMAVLILAPEALVHPSFQMSFAATLALVAAYERGLPGRADADSGTAARLALWGVRGLLGLVVVSLVAGLATTPYAAFHFHRTAPYGLLANLAAMPIVSMWVMPTGLLGLAAMPFGFDGGLWWLMGEGIGWMIGVAQWVAALPGAVGRMAAFGTGPLLAGTLGLVVLCLLRTPLRLAGAALIVAAAAAAIRTAQPDVLIAPDAQAVAVRGADGRLTVHQTGRRDSFAVRSWLSADADVRPPDDPELAAGFACDPAGCIATLAGGQRIARVLSPEALPEDCRRAALVVTTREAPPDCAARVIDRRTLGRSGALALTWTGTDFAIKASRPSTQDRPWARGGPVTAPPAAAARPLPRDATPRPQDLEPGD